MFDYKFYVVLERIPPLLIILEAYIKFGTVLRTLKHDQQGGRREVRLLTPLFKIKNRK